MHFQFSISSGGRNSIMSRSLIILCVFLWIGTTASANDLNSTTGFRTTYEKMPLRGDFRSVGVTNYIREDAQDEELHPLHRTPRLFTFHTDNEDIKVEFEFKVPFVDIPVKRSGDLMQDYAKGLVNINIPALVLSGLIIVGGIGVGKLFHAIHYIDPFAPFYFDREQRSTADYAEDVGFDPKSLPFRLKYRDAKGHSSEIGFIQLMETIETVFQNKKIDVTGCVQKFVCSKTKTIYDGIKMGNAPSASKIADGLLSSKFLLQYIKDTAIMEAINIAKTGDDCAAKYSSCVWSLTNFDTLIDGYIK